MEAAKLMSSMSIQDNEIKHRVATTAIHFHAPETESSSEDVYQPCRRLVRVADLQKDSSSDSDHPLELFDTEASLAVKVLMNTRTMG